MYATTPICTFKYTKCVAVCKGIIYLLKAVIICVTLKNVLSDQKLFN